MAWRGIGGRGGIAAAAAGGEEGGARGLSRVEEDERVEWEWIGLETGPRAGQRLGSGARGGGDVAPSWTATLMSTADKVVNL